MAERYPIIAVRNWFDPRAAKMPWTAYSSEAPKSLAAKMTNPGEGFWECLNFAVDHADNKPDLHLYIPPSCRPSRESTDTTNLLVFFFTYKTGDQGPYPAHLVAIAAKATMLTPEDGGEMVRKHAGKKYGEALTWSLAADPDYACVLVEPLPMASLPVPSLLSPIWGEGRRYLLPQEAAATLDRARKSAAMRVVAGGDEGKAAARQMEVIDRIIAAYAAFWSGETPAPPPPSTKQKVKGGKLKPDAVAGRKAEELVFRRELKAVAKLLKANGRTEKASQLVVWKNADGEDGGHYDIESARITSEGALVKLLLEVKSSKADDFCTVRISARQIACAEECKLDGRMHSFVFVRTGLDGEPVAKSIAYHEVDVVKAWLEPSEYCVVPGKWGSDVQG